MLLCTASRTSSPWYRFVSDTEHWVDSTGSTPCLNSGGIYGFTNLDFIATFVAYGAQNIFKASADATFVGTPTPSKQI